MSHWTLSHRTASQRSLSHESLSRRSQSPCSSAVGRNRQWATFAAGLALSAAALASAPGGACAAEKAAGKQAAGKQSASASSKPTKPASGSAKAAERERARQLVLEGDGFYERHELEQALDRYEQAYRLVRVPTVGIEVVKAQMARGSLVEAQATAQEVATSPRQPGEPAVFEDARQRAAQSILRLSAMIPSLWLEVSPPGVVFEVDIDGVVPSGPPPYRLNPGDHQVRVKASGYATRLLAVTVREAERLNRRVELIAEPAAGAAAAPSLALAAPQAQAAPADVSAAPAIAGEGEAAEAAADTPPSAGPSSSVRTLGWVGLGVAAVAAGAGTYAGIRAFSTKPECPDDTCTPDQQRDIDASLRMGTVANVSVGVAVVAGALGIWALATSGEPGESSASLSELPVTVGLGKLKEIRVSGRF